MLIFWLCFPKCRRGKLSFFALGTEGISVVSACYKGLLEFLDGIQENLHMTDYLNSQMVLFYFVGKLSIINNEICQMLLLYGTSDSCICVNSCNSPAPVLGPDPVRQRELPVWC